MARLYKLILCFIVVAMIGTSFHLSAPAEENSKNNLTWRQTATETELLNNGKMVWRYVSDRKTGKPFMRVALLDGTELTRPHPFTKDYPRPDHTWHCALWFSWKGINGINFWEGHQQGTDPVETKVEKKEDGSAVIRSKISYHLPDAPPIATEQRTITVSAPRADGSYLVTWEMTFTPEGGKDVVFNRNGYGGFAMRLAAECCGDEATGRPRWEFSNSGKNEPNSWRSARWGAYQGPLPGDKKAAVAMFDHPENPRYPITWATRDRYPYLNPVIISKADYTLEKGKTLTLKYGVLIHPGLLPYEKTEKEWKEFAGEKP